MFRRTGRPRVVMAPTQPAGHARVNSVPPTRTTRRRPAARQRPTPQAGWSSRSLPVLIFEPRLWQASRWARGLPVVGRLGFDLPRPSLRTVSVAEQRRQGGKEYLDPADQRPKQAEDEGRGRSGHVAVRPTLPDAGGPGTSRFGLHCRTPEVRAVLGSAYVAGRRVVRLGRSAAYMPGGGGPSQSRLGLHTGRRVVRRAQRPFPGAESRKGKHASRNGKHAARNGKHGDGSGKHARVGCSGRRVGCSGAGLR
ncbi:hypothetical protein HNR02_000310 [Amycolatopsis endophytica]|uniref:Uncharacterized protein n=1 Tax=Amycolatopsis endophytica TaxID=860233 RepID=A0A853AWH9_9PSEU|nr:hypothetical protein [Amycolatopsis endophytica]